jgi:hypothetical protein
LIPGNTIRPSRIFQARANNLLLEVHFGRINITRKYWTMLKILARDKHSSL